MKTSRREEYEENDSRPCVRAELATGTGAEIVEMNTFTAGSLAYDAKSIAKSSKSLRRECRMACLSSTPRSTGLPTFCAIPSLSFPPSVFDLQLEQQREACA